MKWLLKLSIAFIVLIWCLTVTLFGYLVSLGLLNTIEVTAEQLGPYHFIYIERVGDYGDYNAQKKAFAQIESSLAIVLPSVDVLQSEWQLASVYLDNIRQVKREKLRSHIGILINTKAYDKKVIASYFMKESTLPKQLYLTASFPNKNIISFIMGVSKSYSALNKYASKNDYTITGNPMEIYYRQKYDSNVKMTKTLYALPVKSN